MPKLVSTNKIMNSINIYWLMDLGFYRRYVTAENISCAGRFFSCTETTTGSKENVTELSSLTYHN